LAQTSTGLKPARAKSVTLADVRAEPVEWLWPERIPLGAITVLAGDPGLGKSSLSIDLAARLSRGVLGGKPGNVLMLTAEDPLAQVVRPRLEAAGADLDRIRVGSIERDGFAGPIQLPDDALHLRGQLLEH
jgi:hypothetical protein